MPALRRVIIGWPAGAVVGGSDAVGNAGGVSAVVGEAGELWMVDAGAGVGRASGSGAPAGW